MIMKLSSVFRGAAAALLMLPVISCSDYIATGTFPVKTEDFKTLYTLKGTVVRDSLPGTKVIYKLWQGGDILVAADIRTESLHVFSFPGFEPVKTLRMPYSISMYGLDFFRSGIRGTVCGIRSRVSGRIDILTDDLELVQADSGAVYARPYNTMSYDDILPTYIDRRNFWFSSINVSSSTEDRAFCRSARGSSSALELYSLNLVKYPGYDMKLFPWGTSAVYKKGKRAVYAYEQFKVVKFMKMDGSGARTLDFFRYAGNSSDAKWKYIQGYYRGQVHVGRRAIYLANFEFGSGNLSRICSGDFPFDPFTTVETYSYDGEPQSMFRLDREGMLMVDEKGKKFYILDDSDYTIRAYDIPGK